MPWTGNEIFSYSSPLQLVSRGRSTRVRNRRAYLARLPAANRRGLVTVLGKGNKTLLPSAIWRELLRIRQGARLGAPVIASRSRRGHLHPTSIERMVRKAAARGGLELAVTPHWLRSHSDTSHALERGAAIHLVQATLGHASVATTGRYLHARPTDSFSLYLAT